SRRGGAPRPRPADPRRARGRLRTVARRRPRARLLDGDGLARRGPPAGQRRRPRARRRQPHPRLPPLRPEPRPSGNVALVHAPRLRHAERFDGVSRREGDRTDARRRDGGAVAELRTLRPPDPRAGRGRASPRVPRPLLPGRAPLPVQRQVRPALGAALPRLRGRARPAARGPRGNARRGPAAAAGLLTRVRRWVPPLLALTALVLVPWTIWLA